MLTPSEDEPLLSRVGKYYQSDGTRTTTDVKNKDSTLSTLTRSASFKSLNDAFLPTNPLRQPSTAEQLLSRIVNNGFNLPVAAFITKSKDNYLGKGVAFLYEFAVCNFIIVCVFLTILQFLNIEPTSWSIFQQYASSVEQLPRWDLFLGWFFLLTAALTTGIYLRLSLIFSSLSFTIYGVNYPLSFVLCIFQITAMLVNLKKLWKKVIEKINWIDFPEEFEMAYRSCFFEFMTRHEFQRLANIAVIREERAGVFVRTKGDSVSALSFLVSGEVKVLDDDMNVIDIHKQGSLMESPEWCQDNLNPVNGRFSVSLQCRTYIRFIKWPREPLVFLIARNSKLKAQLHAILGIQTSSILLKVRAKKPVKLQSPQKTPSPYERSNSGPPRIVVPVRRAKGVDFQAE